MNKNMEIDLQKFTSLDNDVREIRAEQCGNPYHNIDELPLTPAQKECVLEWFARKIWTITQESTDDPEYYGKNYDPLKIEGNIAHSYVFNLERGGRHHEFKNLAHLEEMLEKEAIGHIRGSIYEAKVC